VSSCSFSRIFFSTWRSRLAHHSTKTRRGGSRRISLSCRGAKTRLPQMPTIMRCEASCCASRGAKAHKGSRSLPSAARSQNQECNLRSSQWPQALCRSDHARLNTSAQKIPAKIANWQTRRKMIIAWCTTYSSIAPGGVDVGYRHLSDCACSPRRGCSKLLTIDNRAAGDTPLPAAVVCQSHAVSQCFLFQSAALDCALPTAWPCRKVQNGDNAGVRHTLGLAN
jgi:hypothetical protein